MNDPSIHLVQRHLSVPMSDDEFMTKARELIDLQCSLQQMEEKVNDAKAKLALVKSTYKDAISTCHDQIDTSTLELKRRIKFLDIDCVAVMDPLRRVIYTRRLDTLEIVPGSLKYFSENPEELTAQEELFADEIPENITLEELVATDEEIEEEIARANDEERDRELEEAEKESDGSSAIPVSGGVDSDDTDDESESGEASETA